MNNNDNKNKIRVPYASRTETILYVAFACVNMVLVAILGIITSVDPIFLSLGFVLLYLIEVAILRYTRKKTAAYVPTKSVYQMLEESCSTIIKDTLMPAMAIDDHGVILWYNDAMAEMLTQDENYIGHNASEILNMDINKSVRADKFTRTVTSFSILRSLLRRRVPIFTLLLLEVIFTSRLSLR